MSAPTYNWQQKGWPRFTYNRAHLSDELSAFADAFRKVKAALRLKQDPELIARTLTDEAVVTSRIEGVTVDESVVMSSICRALGVAYAPSGFTKDARAEGVAEMMLDVRECWNRPTDFLAAMNFVAAKRNYLTKYERHFTDRAKKVILRMFEDGEEGVRSGLSAAKWMRMTKVSKPTATRELSELEKSGAIIAVGAGSQTRYRLAVDLGEPIEPLNEPLNDRLIRLVLNHPGTQLPYLLSVVRESRATVKRVLSALIAEGKVEHRGSKKTGGYYIKQ